MMKNFKFKAKKLKISVLILGLFFLLLVGASPVLASLDKEFQPANLFLPEGTVLEDPLFAAGENININVNAKDDLYLAGANVVISGSVDGDVIVAGAHVVIEADIKGNLRAAGANVIIRGNVAKNITVAGADVTIEDSVEVGKNLLFGAGNVKINSQKVGKNIYGGGGNIVLNSQVDGNAYLHVDPDGSFVVYPETNIQGTLDYKAAVPASIQEGAKIQKEDYKKITAKTKQKSKVDLGGFILAAWLAMLLGTIIVGLVLVTLFKDFTKKTQEEVSKNVLMQILKGFVLLILTPIGLLILAITILGFPLAMILAAVYFIALYVSKIFVAVFVGNKIILAFNKKAKPALIAQMILGVVVLSVIFIIPLIGWIAKLIVVLWGLGLLFTVVKEKLNLEK